MKNRNNPFNIRRSSSSWLGKVAKYDLNSPDNGFELFVSMEYGVRAGIVLLRNYILKGFNTPYLIINRYAPPSENNTVSYTLYVAQKVFNDKKLINKKIDYRSLEFAKLVCAIAFYESHYELNVKQVFELIKKYHL